MSVYDSDGDLAAEYVSGAPAAQNPTISYLTQDALGSVRVVTDSNGELRARRDFLPFGEEIPAGVGDRTSAQKYWVPGDDVRKKFATYQRDSETNLDYAQSRYYSPMLGRFTSPDEFKGGPDELFEFEDDASGNPTFYADITNPQSLNKYQYSYNNPYRFNDPDGHCPFCIVAAVIAFAVLTGPDYVVAPTGRETPEENREYRNTYGGNALLNLIPGGGRTGGLLRRGSGAALRQQARNNALQPVAKTVVKRGANNPVVRSALNKGRKAHKAFAERVKKKGWKSEPSLVDPKTKRVVKPDAVTKNGRPIELKPKTPNGKKKGARQLPAQERATAKKGRVVYYDPKQQ
ncbi:MAG: hypothetical protein IPN69_14520 [Acidobacteria bacterium]|nr:hypothetical protein [Acidobacteriota bacterium]